MTDVDRNAVSDDVVTSLMVGDGEYDGRRLSRRRRWAHARNAARGGARAAAAAAATLAAARRPLRQSAARHPTRLLFEQRDPPTPLARRYVHTTFSLLQYTRPKPSRWAL